MIKVPHLLVLTTALAAFVSVHASGPLQSPKHPDGATAGAAGKRASARTLRATAESETLLTEMFFVSDGAGRRRLMMRGPLQKDHSTRLFWLVDPSTSQYHVIRLTADDVKDAGRIKRIYHRFGVEVSENNISNHLAEHTRTHADRVRAVQDKMRGAAVVQQPDANGACDDIVSGPNESSGGQWIYRCHGLAIADVQGWEPARYYFNVNHLTETDTEIVWTHDETNQTFSVIDSDGGCEANPATFIATSWRTTDCSGVQFSWTGGGFHQFVSGTYQNDDFIHQLSFILGFPIPDFPVITVGSSAIVDYSGGVPSWTYDYSESYSGGYLGEGWLETLLLTGIIDGDAEEGDCSWNCSPTESQLNDCAYLNMTDESHAWRWDYGVCDCVAGASPIIIDLNNDGLALTSVRAGVPFDILATGKAVHVAWTALGSDDAFLVLDRNHNGLIDSGSELFGNVTPQPTPAGSELPNGFLALAVYDRRKEGGNDDGQITDADRIYNDLRLWVDANHDGVSQPNELMSLAAAGVRAIMLRYTTGKHVDEFGNIYRYRGHVIMDRDLAEHGPLKRRAIDVFLKYTSTITH